MVGQGRTQVRIPTEGETANEVSPFTTESRIGELLINTYWQVQMMPFEFEASQEATS